jgi:hypothetical protein
MHVSLSNVIRPTGVCVCVPRLRPIAISNAAFNLP